MLCLSVTLLALFASVQGRAVNISNTWVLPEEGFPVFYRYFRDRISWYEADAVCQFHHANLVTVDTTAQYDAVRAYLKELDISSAVWVGLIRSNPDGDFTWTDYRGLSGEGYWSSAPDARSAPLCAAADPAADYRWEARACGGPTVASFICELPVPQWALGKDGCMIRALPALTALYLPESAAVQLTADCGLAGVKRVQCTGNVKREELLKDLSCNEEDDVTSTISLASTSTVWLASESTFTDQETTNDELSTLGNINNEQKDFSSTARSLSESSTPYNLHTESGISTSTKLNLNIKNYVRIPLDKEIRLEPIHSNDIPEPEYEESSILNHHIKTIEDNKNYQHKLLHNEMTRLGNLETVFTQPTDHFVPPLVMARAKISDDMTVLSLEEKHAQQIAEQRHHKHDKLVKLVRGTQFPEFSTMATPSTLAPTDVTNEPKSIDQLVTDNTKKETKSAVPKKYIEKYNNLKAKSGQPTEYKQEKTEKNDAFSTIKTLSSEKVNIATTTKPKSEVGNSSEEDPSIDLTVIINEPGSANGQQVFYSNHTNILSKTSQEANFIDTHTKQPDLKSSTTEKSIVTTNPVIENKSLGTSTVTLNHEVIKITVINDSTSTETASPVIFEVSTLIPVFHNNSGEVLSLSTVDNNSHTTSLTSNDSIASTTVMATSSSSTTTSQTVSEINTDSTSGISSTNNMATDAEHDVTTIESLVTTHVTTTEAAASASTIFLVNVNVTDNVTKIISTTAGTTTDKEMPTAEKTDIFNHTDNFEEEHDTEMIDDYQSPLLSAANEPLHRPNRSRRPLPPPNRLNKFNPFRILG